MAPLDGDSLDEAGLGLLAEVMALKLGVGDVVALIGDLGAGKTTFARALIRGLLGDSGAEVPSPTFSLAQVYETPRLRVSHFDLYRLSDASEAEEIGLEEAFGTGAALIEWPERAMGLLPADRFEIILDADPAPERRRVTLRGLGTCGARAERMARVFTFLAGCSDARGLQVVHLQGDASTRAYARLRGAGRSLIFMDAPRQPDGPPVRGGLPYSRIAHLAEDVWPFVCIDEALVAAGLSAPRIIAAAANDGLLLLEDLGEGVFGREIARGADQRELWLAAVDALVHLRAHPPPTVLGASGGHVHTLPRFDRAALEIEVELILDWYWPAMMGGPVPDDVRADFRALWSCQFDRMLTEPPGWFLRDYHSPNLIWLPERQGVRRVGVIDFQDALAEHWAYDLASLLQDARVDVPRELENEGLERYCAAVAASEPAFDRAAFASAYARFGAQRNTRLVGLWVRLLKRDGKPQYLAHMARTWDYLARNLAHPELRDLKAWYDTHFPESVRKQPVKA